MNATNDSKNDDRIKRSIAAFSNAMTSQELTMFDQFVFVDQYMNVLVGSDVHFPNIPDRNLKYIRADRLKILGYRYIASEARWTRAPLENL